MLAISQKAQWFAEECLDIAKRVGAKDAEVLQRMAAIWLSVAVVALTQVSDEQQAHDNRLNVRVMN